jgi:hypothetical protein
VDARQRGALGFERRQAHRLVVGAHRFLPLLPRSTAFSQQMVLPPATLLYLRIEEALLPLGRVQAVLERLQRLSSGC